MGKVFKQKIASFNIILNYFKWGKMKKLKTFIHTFEKKIPLLR